MLKMLQTKDIIHKMHAATNEADEAAFSLMSSDIHLLSDDSVTELLLYEKPIFIHHGQAYSRVPHYVKNL